MSQMLFKLVRDHPYITSSLLGGHLTPNPLIVINRHILAYTPILLSYFAGKLLFYAFLVFLRSFILKIKPQWVHRAE